MARALSRERLHAPDTETLKRCHAQIHSWRVSPAHPNPFPAPACSAEICTADDSVESKGTTERGCAGYGSAAGNKGADAAHASAEGGVAPAIVTAIAGAGIPGAGGERSERRACWDERVRAARGQVTGGQVTGGEPAVAVADAEGGRWGGDDGRGPAGAGEGPAFPAGPYRGALPVPLHGPEGHGVGAGAPQNPAPRTSNPRT